MAYPENIPSVDEMLNLAVTDLALMPAALLAAVQAEIETASDRMKAVTALVLSRQEEASDNDYSTTQTTPCRVN